jgi:hypothetical protein
MVGKLFLDLGEDYAFDIRRAREVAEGAGGGGGGGGGDSVNGPYTVGTTTYWIQKQGGVCYVWFDVDADPDPDVRQPVDEFLADENNDILIRNAVQNRAQQLGCG